MASAFYRFAQLIGLINQISDRPVSYVSSNDRMRTASPSLPISFGQGLRLLPDAHHVFEELMDTESENSNKRGAPAKHYLLNYDQVMLLLSIVDGIR